MTQEAQLYLERHDNTPNGRAVGLRIVSGDVVSTISLRNAHIMAGLPVKSYIASDPNTGAVTGVISTEGGINARTAIMDAHTLHEKLAAHFDVAPDSVVEVEAPLDLTSDMMMVEVPEPVVIAPRVISAQRVDDVIIGPITLKRPTPFLSDLWYHVAQRNVNSEVLAAIRMTMALLSTTASTFDQPVSKTTPAPVLAQPESAPELTLPIPTAQRDVNEIVAAYNEECFSLPKISDAECRRSMDVKAIQRSQDFYPDRHTVVYIDMGHGLGEPGASQVQISSPQTWYKNIPTEIADQLVTAKLSPNRVHALKAWGAMQHHFKAQWDQTLAKKGLPATTRYDGYHNLVYVAQILTQKLGLSDKHVFTVEKLVFDHLQAKRLAIVEDKITTAIGYGLRAELAKHNIAVVFSHDPMNKSADPYYQNKMDLPKTLGYRAGLSRHLAEHANVIGVSIHADSNDNITHENSAFYIQDLNNRVPATLGTAIQQSWRQSAGYNPITTTLKKHPTKDLALVAKTVNMGLVETFQLGNGRSRAWAYNFQYNIGGAHETVITSLATPIINTVTSLEDQARMKVTAPKAQPSVR